MPNASCVEHKGAKLCVDSATYAGLAASRSPHASRGGGRSTWRGAAWNGAPGMMPRNESSHAAPRYPRATCPWACVRRTRRSRTPDRTCHPPAPAPAQLVPSFGSIMVLGAGALANRADWTRGGMDVSDRCTVYSFCVESVSHGMAACCVRFDDVAGFASCAACCLTVLGTTSTSAHSGSIGTPANHLPTSLSACPPESAMPPSNGRTA